MKEQKPLLGLARVSTDEQGHDSGALRRQIQMLRDHGATTVLACIVSRSNPNREDIDRGLQAVESGEYRGLLIKDITRLTALSRCFEEVVERLNTCNGELWELDGKIDIADPSRQFLAEVQVLMGKSELIRLKQRVNRSVKLRQKEGKPHGTAPFGYTVRDSRYCFNNEPVLEYPQYSHYQLALKFKAAFFEAGSLQGACQLIGKRYPTDAPTTPETTEIYEFKESDEIDLERVKVIRASFHWNASGFNTWLQNPVLRGHTRHRSRKGNKRLPESEWIIHENTHDDILIDPDEWRQIQTVLENNRKRRGFGSKNAQKYPVSGLIRCECGGVLKIAGAASKTGERYYQCAKYRDGHCKRKAYLKKSEAETIVIGLLVQKAQEIAQLATVKTSDRSPELQELDKRLAELKGIPGSVPEIQQAIEDLSQRIKQLERIEREGTAEKADKLEALAATVGKPHFWHRLENDRKQQLWRWLIESVIMRPQALTYKEKQAIRKTPQRMTKHKWRVVAVQWRF
ncbi:MAG: recombinase family protein [Spirulina sp. SIO3F2]|nr:recombinase family protein [Spirulina sp. SIO3F2]